MPKHEAEIHTLGYLIGRIVGYMQSSNDWQCIIGIEIDGLPEAYAAADNDLAHNLESEYIKAHSSDKYRVTWPDHVSVKKFNSDATYHLV